MPRHEKLAKKKRWSSLYKPSKPSKPREPNKTITETRKETLVNGISTPIRLSELLSKLGIIPGELSKDIFLERNHNLDEEYNIRVVKAARFGAQNPVYDQLMVHYKIELEEYKDDLSEWKEEYKKYKEWAEDVKAERLAADLERARKLLRSHGEIK